jgi:hypothetical protein
MRPAPLRRLPFGKPIQEPNDLVTDPLGRGIGPKGRQVLLPEAPLQLRQAPTVAAAGQMALQEAPLLLGKLSIEVREEL